MPDRIDSEASPALSKHNDPVVIACATDSRYVMPLAVTLRSAIENLPAERSVVIYVIHSGVSAAEREKVSRGWPDKRTEVHWIAADESAVAGVPLWGRMPVSTYFKLLLGDLLPTTVHRALWLDCDLLVLSDVGPLWSADLTGAPLGAVQDAIVPLVSSKSGVTGYAEAGIPADTGYFNAGVMVVDLDKWRDEDIAGRALDYLRRYRKSVVFWDQEGLNAALAARWHSLPETWNYNISVPHRDSNSLAADARILHFAGMLKPWLFRTREPAWSRYIAYLDLTAWAGTRPPKSVKGWAISVYEKSGLRGLLHPAESGALNLIRKLSRSASSTSPETRSLMVTLIGG